MLIRGYRYTRLLTQAISNLISMCILVLLNMLRTRKLTLMCWLNPIVFIWKFKRNSAVIANDIAKDIFEHIFTAAWRTNVGG